jgi:hypothetical protein
VQTLLGSLPEFVSLLASHRPRRLRGMTLAEVMPTNERQPAQLLERYETWGGDPAQMRRAAPSLVFAVIGQARFDGILTPEDESRLLAEMLTFWALRGTLDLSAYCGHRLRSRGSAPAHPPPWHRLASRNRFDIPQPLQLKG